MSDDEVIEHLDDAFDRGETGETGETDTDDDLVTRLRAEADSLESVAPSLAAALREAADRIDRMEQREVSWKEWAEAKEKVRPEEVLALFDRIEKLEGRLESQAKYLEEIKKVDQEAVDLIEEVENELDEANKTIATLREHVSRQARELRRH